MIEALSSSSKSYPAWFDRKNREQDRSVWILLSFRRNDYSNQKLIQRSEYSSRNRIDNSIKDLPFCKNDPTESGDWWGNNQSNTHKI